MINDNEQGLKTVEILTKIRELTEEINFLKMKDDILKRCFKKVTIIKELI